MDNPLQLPPLPHDRLVPVHIAARRLQRSERTVRRWIALGLVPAHRPIGRRAWLIRLPDIAHLQLGRCA
jgi:hypothetical protein